MSDLKDWWSEFRNEISEYLEARLELTKLQLYEKIARISGVMASFFIIALLAVFVVIFLLIMMGTWISSLTGSITIGFSSVGAILIIMLLLLARNREKWLQRPVTNGVIDALVHDEEEYRKQQEHEKKQ